MGCQVRGQTTEKKRRGRLITRPHAEGIAKPEEGGKTKLTCLPRPVGSILLQKPAGSVTFAMPSLSLSSCISYRSGRRDGCCLRAWGDGASGDPRALALAALLLDRVDIRVVIPLPFPSPAGPAPLPAPPLSASPGAGVGGSDTALPPSGGGGTAGGATAAAA